MPKKHLILQLVLAVVLVLHLALMHPLLFLLVQKFLTFHIYLKVKLRRMKELRVW